MNAPKTLFQLFGRPVPTLDPSRAALILIDHQQEYQDGGLPLAGMAEAVAECTNLLGLVRSQDIPVFHIQHLAPTGAPLFDPAGSRVDFIPALAPLPGETVVTKAKPNSFAGTELEARLAESGRDQLVIAGFMTHMCVSTTTRAAAERGHACWVVAAACATRDLILPWGEVVPAAQVQRTTLAELQDSFATVVRDSAALLPHLGAMP